MKKNLKRFKLSGRRRVVLIRKVINLKAQTAENLKRLKAACAGSTVVLIRKVINLKANTAENLKRLKAVGAWSTVVLILESHKH